MAVYYVSSTASGTGNGLSPSDPLSLSQADGAGVFGDQFIFAPGNYPSTNTLIVNRRTAWYASDILDRPVLIADVGFGGDYLVKRGNEGATLSGFVLQCNGLSGGAFFPGAYIDRCDVLDTGRNATSAGNYYGITANSVSRCYVKSGPNSGTYGVHSSSGSVSDCLIEFGGTYRTVVASRVNNCVVFAGGRQSAPTGLYESSITLNSGSQAAFENSTQNKFRFQDLIAVNCGSFTSSTPGLGSVVGCFEFGSTNQFQNPPSDFVSEQGSIFVDADNWDFRLTEAAKLSPYADRLKAIMARLQNVPRITTDSLSDLFGGSSAPSNYSPFKPPAVFGVQ